MYVLFGRLSVFILEADVEVETVSEIIVLCYYIAQSIITRY